MNTSTILTAALNKLCKWRTVLVGWQLGTRAMNDSESNALRDQQDARLIARAELSALTGLLMSKGVFTRAEYEASVTEEAIHLDEMLARQFPGFTTTATGLDIDTAVANETMKRLRFKP